MTTASKLLGIPPAAAPAWLTLTGVLDAMAEGGRRPPCAADPDAWMSERSADRQEAADACTWCPARDACLTFAEKASEAAGVWGGVDRTPRPTRGKAA